MIRCIPLYSGSGGNSTYISCDGEEFLIDAGVSCKALEAGLREIGTSLSNIRAIFVTHEHGDHIKGLEIISKKHAIPVYMNTYSARYIYCTSGHEHLRSVLSILDPTESKTFDSCRFSVTKTPHDSWGSVCYRVTAPDDEFGLATDIGYITKGIAAALLGCRQVVLESNHDIEMLKNGPYPKALRDRILSRSGHLSNADCARFIPFLAQSGAERVFLAHLSKENNTPELALETASRAALETGIEIAVCADKGIF